jgi:Rieske Fe-S protein
MLSSVSENVISCPLHGAQFDAESGNVVQGPADMALITYSITLDEDGETLVVAS